MRSEAIWLGSDERIDRVLATLGLARSRSQAAELIAGQKVYVDGAVVAKSAARVTARSLVEVEELDHYVSRAAHKLLAGLEAFNIEVSDLLALDVGASTGGFTQVLLERGAQRVIALDVGHGQLAPTLREDSRVVVVERCNARELTAEKLQEVSGVTQPPQLVVGDLSFISLALVLPALSQVAARDAQFVLLIKPQFEVGRGGISEGIVTNSQLAAEAVIRVLQNASELGLSTQGLEMSPITGEHGNREVLVHFAREAANDPREWEERVRALFEVGGLT